MRVTDFSQKLFEYLNEFLPRQRNVSNNTIASYCIAFKLFIEFCKNKKGLEPSKLRLRDVTEVLVLEYLSWLENERNCCIATRNQRLAAIHSFIKYVDMEAPENLFEFVKILKIPFKKAPERHMEYLSTDDMALVLRQPNTATMQGRQHLAILSLLYDSAGRAQEIADLTARDFHPIQGKIILTGKGRKVREIPLTTNTLALLCAHMKEWKLSEFGKQDFPLFCNHQRKKLTRAGIAYILAKYVSEAQAFSQTIPQKVTPHVLRHTKAMHLLQADVPMHIIQDILGHSDISTTQRYAHANLLMKAKALESARLLTCETASEINYLDDPNLLDWLSAYARECTG